MVSRPGAAAALALATVAAGIAAGGPAAGQPGKGGGVRLHRVAGFDSPVYVHGPKGAGELVFVVEQAGRVKLIRGERKLAGSFGVDARRRVWVASLDGGVFRIVPR